MYDKIPDDWWYMGDVNLVHGGIAVKLDRTFGYAEIVEGVALYNATDNADGLYMIDKGTVILDRLDLQARRRLRSAMQCVGITMASVLADNPDNKDRRWQELAYAKWVYGERDETNTVIRFVPLEEGEEESESWTPEYSVDGEEGLEAEFLAFLN